MHALDRLKVPLSAFALTFWVCYSETSSRGMRHSAKHYDFGSVREAEPVKIRDDLRDPFLTYENWEQLNIKRRKISEQRRQARLAARREQEKREAELAALKVGGSPSSIQKIISSLKSLAPGQTTTPAFQWLVDGVVLSPDKRTVSINNRVVTEGDTIQGFRVVRIEKDRIELRSKEKSMRLDVSPLPKGVKFLPITKKQQSKYPRYYR